MLPIKYSKITALPRYLAREISYLLLLLHPPCTSSESGPPHGSKLSTLSFSLNILNYIAAVGSGVGNMVGSEVGAKEFNDVGPQVLR